MIQEPVATAGGLELLRREDLERQVELVPEFVLPLLGEHARTHHQAALEIAPDVYCLGPWGRTQTNVDFVCSGASWVLIDAGWASDGPRIERLNRTGFIGEPTLREDGSDAPTQQVLPRAA